MSNGVLAEKVAALYLLHFHLKKCYKRNSSLCQKCYTVVLYANAAGEMIPWRRKSNIFIPQEQDKIIEMTQSEKPENLHFLQPLFLC